MPTQQRKSGRATGNRDRNASVGTRETRERILIVCEGKKTEPNYFKGLTAFYRLARVTVEIVGTGYSTLTLVNHAEQRQGRADQRFAEIWCVFDRDSFAAEDFDNAVHKCSGAPGKEHAFLRVAWSNESFELWYVLHFNDLKTAPVAGGGGTARAWYVSELSKNIKSLSSEKYDKAATDMFEMLENKRHLAIRRAEELLSAHEPHIPFHDQKPATTVHLLVNRLLQDAPGTIT